MSEQKLKKEELLYYPGTWAFLAFLLSPILPAIFYYRNSKLLGTRKKGKQVLIISILFVIVFVILTIIFPEVATLIIFVEMIIAVVIAKKLAKTQMSAYKKMKEEKDLKISRNEAPLILTFLIIWIIFAFGIPYVINKYIEGNYRVMNVSGETIYLPKK